MNEPKCFSSFAVCNFRRGIASMLLDSNEPDVLYLDSNEQEHTSKENKKDEDDPKLEGEVNLEIGEESKDEDNVYPIADVKVNRDQFSLLHLKRLVEERKQVIVAPPYQRNEVWTPRQKSELIESILMGIPLPVIYLFESANGFKQVVDGRQRISTIIDFMNNKFALKDLKILPQYKDKRFSTLPSLAQGALEDYQILYYIIQPPTPERVKYDIFDRVNRGGTKLNSQEMRNALYQGGATKMISKIVKSPEFLKATARNISAKRMRDRYAALRTIAFYLLFSGAKIKDDFNNPITYRSDMDDFLAKIMIHINSNMKGREIINLKNRFLDAFAEIHAILGGDGFRYASSHKKKRAINMPLMEALTFLFMLDWKRPPMEEIKKAINDFKISVDVPGEFRQRVDSSVSVKKRFRRILELAKKFDPDFIPPVEISEE